MSKKFYKEAIEFAQKIVDKIDVRLALYNYASFLLDIGERNQARQVFEQYESLSRELDLRPREFQEAKYD